MADAEAEAAFLSSLQAMNERAGAYNNATENSSGEQIESSDEYDPAQDVQDVSLPGPQLQTSSVDSPNLSSRPNSTNPKITTYPVPNPSDSAATISRPVTRDSAKSPASSSNPINTMGKVPDVPGAVSSPISAIKPRLPNDTVGILEDRIKEDEKGDIDAWLSLIEEHKKRGKVAEVRNVYERFLKVFPLAVCLF
jgi:cleavage stimulation factor subunit 3